MANIRLGEDNFYGIYELVMSMKFLGRKPVNNYAMQFLLFYNFYHITRRTHKLDIRMLENYFIGEIKSRYTEFA
jgi:hypothetical protein